jgi:hypothetical protein
MRARCLMVILIGNLDLALEPDKRQTRSSLPPAVDPEVIEGQPRIASPGLPTGADNKTSDEDKPVARPQTEPVPEIGIEEPTQPEDDDWPALTERGNELPRRTSTSMSIALSSLPVANHGPPSPSSTFKNGTRSLDLPNRHGFTQSESSLRTKINRRPTVQEAASPWRHMENLLYEIRLYDDEDRVRGEYPRQWPKHICNRVGW